MSLGKGREVLKKSKTFPGRALGEDKFVLEGKKSRIFNSM
jgi:hypothetical protein